MKYLLLMLSILPTACHSMQEYFLFSADKSTVRSTPLKCPYCETKYFGNSSVKNRHSAAYSILQSHIKENHFKENQPAPTKNQKDNCSDEDEFVVVD